MRGHGLGEHPAGVWIPGGRKDLERLELRGGEREGWDEAREACGLSVKPTLHVLIPGATGSQPFQFSAGER